MRWARCDDMKPKSQVDPNPANCLFLCVGTNYPTLLSTSYPNNLTHRYSSQDCKSKFSILRIAMSCLHCYSPFLPLNSQLKHKQKLKAKRHLRLFSTESSPNLVLQTRNVNSRTNATSNPLFIAAKVPPSQSGDITVFLQTSALLLVVYFLANFVAPYFISKYFEFDKIGEDQKRNENNDNKGR
ncbi:hypothetical protein E1A91_A01G085700v1 [Gossypium mustelinum]|uniref:Uncharacterized protein n=4 Tax=Gossypium TaxID=3633 RepID=A0A5D3AAX7_GOSMU|nr:hypothetical protein E1A91_A01G085700v1 [Gossypium mustelinum]